MVMHIDQIHIDADMAREMLFEQFPAYRDEPVQAIGHGTQTAVFKIGSWASARFPLRGSDPVACLGTLRREAGAMVRFAEASTVASPRPLGFGKPGSRYPMPWAVQTWVEGRVATPDGLATSAPFAVDVADLIASMRTAGTHGERFDGRGRGGRLADHDEWIAVCLANSEGLLDVPRLRDAWTSWRELPAAEGEVMSHKDLVPSNLLVDGERLVGVLDCGGFGPADPALDLVSAWHLFDRPRREAIRDRLGCSDAQWRRGAAWAFQQAIGLVWYYRHSHPGMSELGRSTLARLFSDPDAIP